MRWLSSIPIERDSWDLGEVAQTQQEASEFQQQGWLKCENPACFFFASPEGAQWMAEYSNSVYTCPNCGEYQKVMSGWKFDDDQKTARSGMSLSELGKLGEMSIYYAASKMPEWQERYGSIVWWQSGVTDLRAGGALDIGKLDGISQGPDGTIWGIEVKSADIENQDPGFNIDNVQRDDKHMYAANFARHEPEIARQLRIEPKGEVGNPRRDFTPSQKRRKNKGEPSGKLLNHQFDQGNNDIDALLGVLPVFDFKNSEVNIYVKESPLSGHSHPRFPNATNHGFVKFRANPQTVLLEKIPFANPYMQPLENEFPIVATRQVFDPSSPTDDELTFKNNETAIGHDPLGGGFDPMGGQGFEEETPF